MIINIQQKKVFFQKQSYVQKYCPPTLQNIFTIYICRHVICRKNMWLYSTINENQLSCHPLSALIFD